MEKINRPASLVVLALATLLLVIWLFRAKPLPPLPTVEQRAIAKRIYLNECAGKAKYLVTWGTGEQFPSLGIGHFIWYPAGYHGPFDESFPTLIRFIHEHGVELPPLLAHNPIQPAPWPNRNAFEAALMLNDHKISMLRNFLERTMSLQAAFMADRMKHALSLILHSISESRRRFIRRQFIRLANAPFGYYPLIDYVNFKGEGVSPSERYQGKGWGLLQVLSHMTGKGSPTADFSRAAAWVLKRRVRLSPSARHEGRWLPGWLKRVQTYASAPP